MCERTCVSPGSRIEIFLKVLSTGCYATRPCHPHVPICSMYWPNLFCQTEHFWRATLRYSTTSPTPAGCGEHHPADGGAQAQEPCPILALGAALSRGWTFSMDQSWSLCWDPSGLPGLIPPRSPCFSESGPRGLQEGRLFCSFLKLILLLSLFTSVLTPHSKSKPASLTASLSSDRESGWSLTGGQGGQQSHARSGPPKTTGQQDVRQHRNATRWY